MHEKAVNLLSPCPEFMLFLGPGDVASILCCGMSWQLETTVCPPAKEKADWKKRKKKLFT